MIQTMREKDTRNMVYDTIKKALDDLDIPGIQVSLQPGGSYSDTNIKMKIEAAVINESGEAQTSESKQWQFHCKALGFRKDDLGKQFLMGGRTLVTLTGCKVSRRRYPLNVKRVDTGTEYKCGIRDLTRV